MWLALQQWLEGFAYRVTIAPGIFLLGAIILLLIATFTISIQAIKAAVRILSNTSTDKNLNTLYMIQLNNIEKYYKKGLQKTWILRDISLTIKEGEFVTIMGPSGAGKTTLLNILGMLDAPSKGGYQLFDEEVFKLNERRRNDLHKQYMGFVFQAYHLIDDLTVYENIETPLLYRGIKGKERKSMVAEILDRFQMVAKKDLFPEQLSGGQQQLVGVARAIIHKPRVLLADEPTGNLHSKQGESIMNLFKELNEEGMTIIQVTHSEKNAQYGHRIIELEDGFIKEDIAVG